MTHLTSLPFSTHKRHCVQARARRHSSPSNARGKPMTFPRSPHLREAANPFPRLPETHRQLIQTPGGEAMTQGANAILIFFRRDRSRNCDRLRSSPFHEFRSQHVSLPTFGLTRAGFSPGQPSRCARLRWFGRVLRRAGTIPRVHFVVSGCSWCGPCR